MRRDDVAAALRDEHERDGYLRPDYDGYCFAGVGPTVTDLFGVDAGRTLPDDVFAGVDTDVSHVVLVLVDGFGLDRWRADADRYELFDALDTRGTVTPLTSVYPSETGSAIPTLHTGRTPAEHGMLGWEWYDPEVGAVVQGLPFVRKGSGDSAADVMDPAELFAGDPIYDALVADGVDAHAVQPESIAGSPSSEAMLGAAEDHPAANAAELALTVRQTLESADGPTCCYAYFGMADALAHFAGTDSADYRAQLGAVADALQRQLVEGLDPETAAETLLVVTADHGLVDTDPDDYVDLVAVDGVADALRTGPGGDPLPPVGSPRSAHLHLDDGATDRVAAALDDRLDAFVTTGEDALADGLFGPDPCERARRRAGDVVLSHRERTAWCDDEDHLGHVGNHGGLHPEEMLVPFAAASVDALR
ncbi:alkaline phosphatase family protein [Halosimplex halophilum]|uniref:alkaline phosphatase family protein n=1 Tax=Halosimplex halophilum TaxID=2559572 RepID=UPI00107F86A8|nr:alkaline phosphatase family protein [Halosimplex halophilum]